MILRRSPLLARTPLQRRKPLKRKPRRLPPREFNLSRAVWKTPRHGYCSVCGKEGVIVRHHILLEQKIRAAGRFDVLYDLRNALEVGSDSTCDCHYAHHRALRDGRPWRIPLMLIPASAREFAIEVLGEGPAERYFEDTYGRDQ